MTFLRSALEALSLWKRSTPTSTSSSPASAAGSTASSTSPASSPHDGWRAPRIHPVHFSVGRDSDGEDRIWIDGAGYLLPEGTSPSDPRLEIVRRVVLGEYGEGGEGPRGALRRVLGQDFELLEYACREGFDAFFDLLALHAGLGTEAEFLEARRVPDMFRTPLLDAIPAYAIEVAEEGGGSWKALHIFPGPSSLPDARSRLAYGVIDALDELVDRKGLRHWELDGFGRWLKSEFSCGDLSLPEPLEYRQGAYAVSVRRMPFTEWRGLGAAA